MADSRWQPELLFAAAALAEVEEIRARRRSRPPAAAGTTELELITAEEAAKLLGVGRTTIYRLAKESVLTRIHIGRCARYLRAEVEEYARRLYDEARRSASA